MTQYKQINSKCKFCPAGTWAKKADNHFGMQPCLMEGSPYRVYCITDIKDWKKEAEAADKIEELLEKEGEINEGIGVVCRNTIDRKSV